METSFLSMEKNKTSIIFDPRSKLFLLITVTSLLLSTGNSGSMNIIRPFLSIIPFILIITERRYKTAVKYLILYLLCFVMEHIAVKNFEGIFSYVLLATCSIMTRFAPGFMTGAYLLATTSVSEFISAMEKMHLPDKIVIPLSVIFRFFPTIKEEYESITDAMKMRGIRFGGKNPLLMIEYRLIPLIFSVIKIGDELSAASLTRGLGAPVKRTNVCRIGIHIQDVLMIAVCLICFAGFFIYG
ncbi:energy-coupling factor transporter transmembrane component T [uncultured Clostridium sp.]|uniref:energy-coupling factor transporter transmembrane component T n=1 Tax=uncultured Clostridium sp. TaxID=59620 RepID=UPI0025D44812|nr:energy-coupling factor transporter transmembrane component T [uncultured Clostridium sp.]